MPINQKEIKQKDEILQHLRNDINYYSSGELRAFVASDVITQEDLHVVFSHNQIEAVCDDYNHKIDRISVNLINIPTGDLEIYFWGDIDSGKTCAIDALLTVLHTKGIILQNKDDYFNYLHSYKARHGYVVIPSKQKEGGTHVLNLKTANAKGMERRVSIIEVSGMVCNAIHMAMHNVELSDKEKSEIEQVKQYIESRKSVKIHFFATEYRYSRKNSKDKDTPEAILTSLVDFWKRKISFVNTIGAYVLVTKCDKILNVGKICSDSLLPTRDNNTTPRHAYEYVKEHLPSFWIHLKEVCNERHIRNVRTVSFSVGEVFAQDLCRFDGRDAEKVINLIVSTASRPNLFVLLWERLYKKSKKEPAYL